MNTFIKNYINDEARYSNTLILQQSYQKIYSIRLIC